MKYITVLLFIVVCFFGGMTYGSIETNYALTQSAESAEGEDMVMDPFVEEDIFVNKPNDLTEKEPSMLKVANIIEGLFKMVYEMLLKLLYTISEFFF